MNDYPTVHEGDGSLKVEFAVPVAGSKGRPIEMVLDFDQLGRVIGIEIINLIFHVGRNGLKVIYHSVQTDGEGLRYSYDEDSDSFYLRLKVDKSVDQKVVEGSMLLDEEGQILALGAKWQQELK